MMLINPFFDRSGTRGLYCDFNSFPFTDSYGNFTVNNVSVTQTSGNAVFDGTHPQYLEFIGAETFNLQESVDIEIAITNRNLTASYHSVFELKGATSYLVVSLFNIAFYEVFLTGATGGNTDNYAIIGSIVSFNIGQPKTLRVVYDAALGRLRTYVDGVLDISQEGITPRVNEARTMYAGTISYLELRAALDYFKVSIG